MLPTHSIRKPVPRKKTESPSLSCFQSEGRGGAPNKKLVLLLAFLVVVSFSSLAYIWDLQSSLDEAEVQKEISRIQVQELQKMVKSNSIERANFQQALLDSQNSVTEREKTISSLRSQLSDCRSSFDDLSGQKLHADSHLLSSRKENERLGSQIIELQKQKDEAETKLDKSINEKDLIIKERENLKTRFLDLEKQLREAKKELEASQAPLIDSQQQLEDQLKQPKQSFAPLVPDEDPESEERRQAVKGAMKFAWDMYVEHAWGKDELKPITKTGAAWFNLGLTIVDSIDTLFIMGLEDEYHKARDWIEKDMHYEGKSMDSTFEITIRNLGGLLGIFSLTGDQMFLDRAEDLGHRLLKAFVTPSGFPNSIINLKTGESDKHWWSTSSILSEVGSVQLEFLYLSYLTKNSTFAEKPMTIIKKLRELKAEHGLYSAFLDTRTGRMTNNHFTVGAFADSFYEYQLKLWLLTNKQYEGYRKMYDESSNGIISKLSIETDPGLVFIGELNGGAFMNQMEHLVCFAGGMFSLGSHEGAVSNSREQMKIAKGVTEACFASYNTTATGLAPDVFTFQQDLGPLPGQERKFMLRPETVESLFVMWRLTHDQKYRDWGWQIFQSIEKHCKTPGGYAGIRDVTHIPVDHDDLQQSFFMAETLKYLYLLFGPDDIIPLSDFVFNTEAHPFKIIPETSDSMPRDLHKHLMLF